MNGCTYRAKTEKEDNQKIFRYLYKILQNNGVTVTLYGTEEAYKQEPSGLAPYCLKFETKFYHSGNSTVFAYISRNKRFKKRFEGELNVMISTESRGELEYLCNSLTKKFGKNLVDN